MMLLTILWVIQLTVTSALCDEGHTYFSPSIVCPVFVLWEFSFETLTLQVEMIPLEVVTIELLG